MEKGFWGGFRGIEHRGRRREPLHHGSGNLSAAVRPPDRLSAPRKPPRKPFPETSPNQEEAHDSTMPKHE
jgi:hypothetical protein